MKYYPHYLVISRMIALCAIVFVACQPPKVEEYKDTSQYIKERMHYYKDKRTGLCFIANNLGWNSSIITNVPCTVEVENQIRFDKNGSSD